MDDRPPQMRIRAYKPEDKEGILALIEREYGRGTRDARALLWDWIHDWDDDFPQPNIGRIAESGGTIIGYAGSLPARIKVGDHVEYGTLSMDNVMDSNHRGKGIRLLRAQLDTRVILGSTAARSHRLWARIARKPLDRTVFKEQVKRICAIDPTVRLLQKGLPAIPARLAGFLWRCGLALRYGPYRPLSGRKLERVAEFPPQIDDFCKEFSRRFKYMVVRDRRFLNWRYVACPVPYEKYCLYDEEELSGYMSFRVCMVRRRKVLLLVEIAAIGREEESYQMMIAFLQKCARERDVSDIQTMDSGDPLLERALTRKGFYPKKGRTPIIGQVCRELDQKYPDIHSTRERSGWHICLGDSEFEFVFFDFDGRFGMIADTSP